MPYNLKRLQYEIFRILPLRIKKGCRAQVIKNSKHANSMQILNHNIIAFRGCNYNFYKNSLIMCLLVDHCYKEIKVKVKNE